MHYKAWSYKKKKHKKIEVYSKCLQKEPAVNRCLLILDHLDIVQSTTFYRQRIPESSSARKETVEIDIPVTCANGDKNHAVYQNKEQLSLKNKEVELVEPVQMNIYQSNTYRKDWLHLDNEPREVASLKESASEGPTV